MELLAFGGFLSLIVLFYCCIRKYIREYVLIEQRYPFESFIEAIKKLSKQNEKVAAQVGNLPDFPYELSLRKLRREKQRIIEALQMPQLVNCPAYKIESEYLRLTSEGSV